MSFKVMYYDNTSKSEKVICNITSDSIHLEFYEISDNENKLVEADILLSDIRSSQNIDDGSLYVVDIDKSKTNIMPVFNYTAYSLSDRSHFRVRDSDDRTGILYIFIPFAEASFNECEIFIVLARNTVLTSNIEYSEVPFISMVSYQKMNELLYPIKFSATSNTVRAEDKININISVYDYNNQILDYPIEIYLTSHTGYLPYRKVKVVGTTEIPVYAFGLKAGDTIRVKAGYRWYTNVANIDIEVI